MTNDDGNGGNGGGLTYSGIPIDDRTPFVFRNECLRTHEDLNKRVTKTNLALYGEDGTGGIVRTLHDMKMQIKFGIAILAFILAVVSPIITAFLLKRVGVGG